MIAIGTPVNLKWQVLLGIGLAVAVVCGYLLWENWSRAPLLAMALVFLLAAAVILKYPLVSLLLTGLALTIDSNAIVWRSFDGLLLLTVVGLLANKLLSGDFNLRITPFVGWYLLFFSWILASRVWAVYSVGIVSNELIYSLALIISVSQLIDTPERLRAIMIALSLGMVITAVSSVYGVYALFTKGLALAYTGSIEGLATARYFGHWHHPNALAHTLMPLVPFLFPFCEREEKPGIQIVAILGILSGIVAVGMSMSRAGILGLAVAVSITIAVSARRWVMIGVVSLVVLGTVLLLPVNLIGRVESFGQGRTDASVNQRTHILESTLKMIEDSFPLGSGLGSYRALQQDYEDLVFVAPHSHNTYTQIIAEQGAVGIVLFLIATSSLVSALRRRRAIQSRFTLAGRMRVAMMASLAAMFVASPFEDRSTFPAYCLAGTLISLYPTIFGAESAQSEPA